GSASGPASARQAAIAQLPGNAPPPQATVAAGASWAAIAKPQTRPPSGCPLRAPETIRRLTTQSPGTPKSGAPEAPPLASRAAPLCRWRPWQYNTATRRDASTTVWEGCKMSVNVAPGALMLYVLSAVLLTIPVSLLLVWRYRRSVQKTMRRASLAG